jgi:hypothetical protein
MCVSIRTGGAWQVNQRVTPLSISHIKSDGKYIGFASGQADPPCMIVLHKNESRTPVYSFPGPARRLAFDPFGKSVVVALPNARLQTRNMIEAPVAAAAVAPGGVQAPIGITMAMPADIVAMDWTPAATHAIRRPSLAILMQNGILELRCGMDDKSPIRVDTGIRFDTTFPNDDEPYPEIAWNCTGTLLAVPNPTPVRGKLSIQFYQPNGARLHEMMLPPGERVVHFVWADKARVPMGMAATSMHQHIARIQRIIGGRDRAQAVERTAGLAEIYQTTKNNNNMDRKRGSDAVEEENFPWVPPSASHFFNPTAAANTATSSAASSTHSSPILGASPSPPPSVSPDNGDLLVQLVVLTNASLILCHLRPRSLFAYMPGSSTLAYSYFFPVSEQYQLAATRPTRVKRLAGVEYDEEDEKNQFAERIPMGQSLMGSALVRAVGLGGDDDKPATTRPLVDMANLWGARARRAAAGTDREDVLGDDTYLNHPVTSPLPWYHLVFWNQAREIPHLFKCHSPIFLLRAPPPRSSIGLPSPSAAASSSSFVPEPIVTSLDDDNVMTPRRFSTLVGASRGSGNDIVAMIRECTAEEIAALPESERALDNGIFEVEQKYVTELRTRQMEIRAKHHAKYGQGIRPAARHVVPMLLARRGQQVGGGIAGVAGAVDLPFEEEADLRAEVFADADDPRLLIPPQLLMDVQRGDVAANAAAAFVAQAAGLPHPYDAHNQPQGGAVGLPPVPVVVPPVLPQPLIPLVPPPLHVQQPHMYGPQNDPNGSDDDDELADAIASLGGGRGGLGFPRPGAVPPDAAAAAAAIDGDNKSENKGETWVPPPLLNRFERYMMVICDNSGRTLSSRMTRIQPLYCAVSHQCVCVASQGTIHIWNFRASATSSTIVEAIISVGEGHDAAKNGHITAVALHGTTLFVGIKLADDSIILQYSCFSRTSASSTSSTSSTSSPSDHGEYHLMHRYRTNGVPSLLSINMDASLIAMVDTEGRLLCLPIVGTHPAASPHGVSDDHLLHSPEVTSTESKTVATTTSTTPALTRPNRYQGATGLVWSDDHPRQVAIMCHSTVSLCSWKEYSPALATSALGYATSMPPSDVKVFPLGESAELLHVGGGCIRVAHLQKLLTTQFQSSPTRALVTTLLIRGGGLSTALATDTSISSGSNIVTVGTVPWTPTHGRAARPTFNVSLRDAAFSSTILRAITAVSLSLSRHLLRLSPHRSYLFCFSLVIVLGSSKCLPFL